MKVMDIDVIEIPSFEGKLATRASALKANLFAQVGAVVDSRI